eukprot:TRINITY_DN966_c2_g2_i1.p1 TRINITY_DN966_c2_g2~~TRINITY_DN966_c2_g2_i1.p1  ORF type:complete len:100 (+),score=18.35 TRINITY_DN966_c2_g2_i1:301-600(+)
MCKRASKEPLVAAEIRETTKERKYDEEFKRLEGQLPLKPVFSLSLSSASAPSVAGRNFFWTLSNAASTFSSAPFHGRLQSLLQAVSVPLQRCNGSDDRP